MEVYIESLKGWACLILFAPASLSDQSILISSNRVLEVGRTRYYLLNKYSRTQKWL